jgi:hypothetical protein
VLRWLREGCRHAAKGPAARVWGYVRRPASTRALLALRSPLSFSPPPRHTLPLLPQENDGVALRPALRVLRVLLQLEDGLQGWRRPLALETVCNCIAANTEYRVATETCMFAVLRAVRASAELDACFRGVRGLRP